MQAHSNPSRATRLDANDHARAVGALTLAFSADPICRWCWPSASEYLDGFPAFVRAFGGRAFVSGGAYQTANFAGAALWLPPGIEPDDAEVGAVIENTAAPALRDSLYSLMEQMSRHHPNGAHWYLPLIGVEPMHQGRGLGNTLMETVLKRCDEEQLAAYLESTNPRNIPFYERLGFRRVGAIQVGTSPVVVPMLREVQS
jgi:ribosomal protein S18 acetylase RimI-like enzyme